MKNILFIILIGCIPLALFSQNSTHELVASSGGERSIGSLTVSWSVGEPAIGELRGSDYTLSQGFQQGNVAVLSGLKNHTGSFEINVYPNPVSEKLNIRINSSSLSPVWRIELYSPDGKLFLQTRTTQQETEMDLTNLVAGTYLIRIYNQQGLEKVFNIVKQSSHEKN
jgi:hypothetical protein